MSHFYTRFPDDDYPCCELVTSFTRGRNLDRYRKYDTTFRSEFFFFFLWSCVILNWINMKIIFRHIYTW
jgi:hypothetical protein